MLWWRPRYRNAHRADLTADLEEPEIAATDRHGGGDVAAILSQVPLIRCVPAERRLTGGMLSTGRLALATASMVLAGCDGGSQAGPTTVSPGAVEANAVVAYVVDGDTIDATIDAPGGATDERVRLIGIDTPETKRPDTPIECYGPEASEFVTDLLPVGTPIRIERDTVARDDFGRLLGYVYRAEDGLFVNHEIIRQGYATPLSIAPNTTFEQLMVDAATSAEAADLGLWSACAR